LCRSDRHLFWKRKPHNKSHDFLDVHIKAQPVYCGTVIEQIFEEIHIPYENRSKTQISDWILSWSFGFSAAVGDRYPVDNSARVIRDPGIHN
jgi:hypothetical protein